MGENRMIHCREVAGLVASDQLMGAGFMKRAAVALHLAMCKYCSRFKRQIQQLGLAARKLARTTDRERAGMAGDSLEARLLRKLTERSS